MRPWIGRMGTLIRRERAGDGGAPAMGRLVRYSRGETWWINVLCITLGGSLGALTRYGTSLFAADHLGSELPWGTLIVNLSGCLLIGICYALGERGARVMIPPARLFFVTGYLGSLTTFSTFALETVSAMNAEAHTVMAVSLVFNNVLGIVLVFLGRWIGRPR